MNRILKITVMILSAVFVMTGCAKNPSAAGVEYLGNGQYKEAIEQFEQAIDKGINEGDAYRGIGIAKWEQEDYRGAREAFLNAIDQGVTESGTVYNFVGCCDLMLEDASDALQYFNLALDDENNSGELNQEIRYNIIAAYEQMEDYDSAKVKLEEYVKLYPDDADAKKDFDFWSTR